MRKFQSAKQSFQLLFSVATSSLLGFYIAYFITGDPLSLKSFNMIEIALNALEYSILSFLAGNYIIAFLSYLIIHFILIQALSTKLKKLEIKYFVLNSLFALIAGLFYSIMYVEWFNK